MPMDTQDIARSFLDWSSEEVTKWLATLSLSQDYSQQFQGSPSYSIAVYLVTHNQVAGFIYNFI